MFDELDNGGLFGEENGDSDRLSPPPDAEREDNDPEEAGPSSQPSKRAVAVKPRRVVQNPRPKLNPERLSGDRGLLQLPKIFANFTPKGKGHEKDDLDRMMKMMEHWAYRLFPNLPFTVVLDRIEKLGTKKQVQTFIKRIRMDLVTADDDFVRRGDEDLGPDANPVSMDNHVCMDDVEPNMARPAPDLFGDNEDQI